MSTLKCKMCGGTLEITESQTVCECEYCGSKQTISNVDDEKILKLYDRANRFRMANEFDKAATVYEGIIEENDAEAEAYWGLMLCKFGIEYVDDPVTGEKIPTCHRSSFDSFMDDSDFEMVMSNSDSLSRAVYREQAKQIEELRKGIIEVSGKEAAYDVFICYKETDENGNRTVDSVMAQDIYDQLTGKGYRVFFSRITLEDKLGQEYEPYIFAALNSAKIMLAFGTNYDFYNAVWVKNEWSRYLKLMEKDKSKRLIPCYRDIDAYDIPAEFKHLQAQDMGKVGADQDLIRGIEKILGVSALRRQDTQLMAANIGSNINALLERGFMTLEDGDFSKADTLFEDVLNQNPKCAEAYMGKLLAYYCVRNITSFAELIFNKVFNEYNEKSIVGPSLDDIKSVIKERYVLGNRISDEIVKRIHEQFITVYNTNIDALAKYDNSNDYIEIFCGLNNSSDNDMQLDYRYYERFKQFATVDVQTRFSIKSILDDLVSQSIKKSEGEIEELRRQYDDFVRLVDVANDKVHYITGDELYQIDAIYQCQISAWEEREREKQVVFEKECQEITENWSRKRKEIQDNWKAECDRIKAVYDAKKANYDAELARVRVWNAQVQEAFSLAVNKYEQEKWELEKQIGKLKEEYASLGFFRVKEKETLRNNIAMLEDKRTSLVCPDAASFGQILSEPEDIGVLHLPPQPVDSVTPILPSKPLPEEKPVRGECSTEVDAVEVLCEALSRKNFSTASIVSQNEIEKEKIRLERERQEKEAELVTLLKPLGIAIKSISEKKIILSLGSNQNGEADFWRVLEKRGKKILLVSENVIDVKPYNVEHKSVDWEKCTLRAYLNREFLNAFSEQFIGRIDKVKLVNKNNIEHGMTGGSDTEDKVFCLSIDEAKQYFNDDSDRIAYPTEFAKKITTNKAFVNEKTGGSAWWLRSPGAFEDFAAPVYGDGTIYVPGHPVNHNFAGIRPAMWISLE